MKKIFHYIDLTLDYLCMAMKWIVKFLLKMTIWLVIIFTPALCKQFLVKPRIQVVIKHEGKYELVDTSRVCSREEKIRFTVESDSSNYEPSIDDTCVNCGKPYWGHWIYRTEEQKKEAENALENMLTYPS